MNPKTLIVVLAVVAVVLGIPIWAQEGTSLSRGTNNHLATAARFAAPNDYGLKVEAVAAGPDDDGEAFILAVVTFEGAGLNGLTRWNFRLGTHFVVPDGPKLEIRDVVALGDGKYGLHVVPTNGQPWTLGRYLLSVKVDLRPFRKASGMTAVALDVTTPGVGPTPFITSVQPVSSATRDPIPVTLTITGLNFQPGAVVGFTPGGVSIDSITFESETKITVVIRIDVTVVPPQDFDITVINPDGGQDTLPAAFTAI